MIAGQLDLLALLEPEVPTTSDEMTPAEKVEKWGYPYTIPGTSCIACGHVFTSDFDGSRNHSWLPFQDVCMSMSLTKNHVQYWCMVMAGTYTSPDKKCCHGAIKEHVGKERPEYWQDHLRRDIERAREVWGAIPWLRPMLEKYGVTEVAA